MLGDKSPIRSSFERQRIADDIVARERDCNRLVQACASKNPCGLSDLIEAATDSISAGQDLDNAARVLTLIAQSPPELIAEVEVDAMTNSLLASVSSETPTLSSLVALQTFAPQKPFEITDGVYPLLSKLEDPKIICEVLRTLHCCGADAALESVDVVEQLLQSTDNTVLAEVASLLKLFSTDAASCVPSLVAAIDRHVQNPMLARPLAFALVAIDPAGAQTNHSPDSQEVRDSVFQALRMIGASGHNLRQNLQDQWTKQQVVTGVSLRDLAECFSNDDDEQNEDAEKNAIRGLVKQMRNRTSTPLPKPIGKCPNDARAFLFKTSELLEFYKEFRNADISGDIGLERKLQERAREPRPFVVES